jgi:conjugative relaxase-like TrwC/TraI family protein
LRKRNLHESSVLPSFGSVVVISPRTCPKGPGCIYVICSVTVLGARGRTFGAVAADVVAYLEGQRAERGGSRAGQSTELPSPDGGLTTYYADSAGEGSGTWIGRGIDALGLSGEVDGTDLRSVLSGLDPRTHVDLLSPQGSAGRTGGPTGRLDGREWWTLREVGEVIGVSPSYLRRLVDQTQVAIAERTFALMAGQTTSPWTSLWLVAEKQGRAWRVSGTELRDYLNMRQPPTVVVGYDVTFSVEKSVSALWARADDAVRAEIIASVDASVAAGVDYLERQALRVRIGGKRQEAQGLVAASYLHSTSRAFDPQLHRHVVIANVATGPDGVNRALDSPSLFHHAKTAGYVAGAELRHQLTARLGVQWTTVSRGLSEVVGVSEEAMAAISTRSQEMAAAALAIDMESGGSIGTESPAARQALALATRSPKTTGVDPEGLRAGWIHTLDAAGLDAEALSGALHRVVGPTLIRSEERAELFAHLASDHGVTENLATFDRRHVIQAVAAWSVDRLSAAACEDLADHWLASPEVVPLRSVRHQFQGGDVIRRHDGVVVATAVEQQFSTRTMLATEVRIEANYERGRGLGRAVVAPQTVDAVLARPGFAHLSDEQCELVRHVTSAGHETTLVHGPAGTGKTTAIEAAARAWEDQGYWVLGASVNGNAAEILGRSAGIDSTTVASLLWRVEHGDARLLGDRTVVVLDEATTLATRDLDRLLTYVHQGGASLHLVGDPAQHSAVGAGGAFRWLIETYPDDVAALTVNRRQVGDDMAEVRLALEQYRSGAVKDAMARLEGDHRIVTADSAIELFDALAADWYVDRQRAQDDPAFERSSMTAAHHDERRALTERARAMLRADGTLHGPEFVAAGVRFSAGDEVMAKVPDRTLRPEGGDKGSFVKNGTRGTVLEVGDDHIRVDFEHRGPIDVPRSYLEQEVSPGLRGGLLHSYCLTTYAAQGDTYGSARHLGTDHSSRAELYVGLTRGRHDATLYAVHRSDVMAPVLDDDLPRLRDDTNAARAMAASAAGGGTERLGREVDPIVMEASSLADRHTVGELDVMVTEAHDDKRPLFRRAHEMATHRVMAEAISEPSAILREMLGDRPSAERGDQAEQKGASPRDLWDDAVGAVALYEATYKCHRFPSDDPTNELIGLRALAPDLEAWDRVDAVVGKYVATVPRIEVVHEIDFGPTIEMEM